MLRDVICCRRAGNVIHRAVRREVELYLVSICPNISTLAHLVQIQCDDISCTGFEELVLAVEDELPVRIGLLPVAVGGTARTVVLFDDPMLTISTESKYLFHRNAERERDIEYVTLKARQ